MTDLPQLRQQSSLGCFWEDDRTGHLMPRKIQSGRNSPLLPSLLSISVSLFLTFLVHEIRATNRTNKKLHCLCWQYKPSTCLQVFVALDFCKLPQLPHFLPFLLMTCSGKLRNAGRGDQADGNIISRALIWRVWVWLMMIPSGFLDSPVSKWFLQHYSVQA